MEAHHDTGIDLNMGAQEDDGLIDLNLPLDEHGAIDFEAPQFGMFVMYFKLITSCYRTG